MARRNLLFAFGSCCWIVLSLATARAQEKPPATPGPALRELAADLKAARELLVHVTDKGTRERLELLITRSELKAIELEKAWGASAVPAAKPSAMSAENFAKLLKTVKGEAFDEGKAGVIASFAANGRLNCEQARELLKTFSFDDHRVTSAAALYPRLTDPENFFTVFEIFKFSSSRDLLREKLKLGK